MPRSIIDTASSRPAYRRRQIRRWIWTLLILVLLAAAMWFLAHRAHAQEIGFAGGTAVAQCLWAEKGVLCEALSLR
jgi:hypothetical protein